MSFLNSGLLFTVAECFCNQHSLEGVNPFDFVKIFLSEINSIYSESKNLELNFNNGELSNQVYMITCLNNFIKNLIKFRTKGKIDLYNNQFCILEGASDEDMRKLLISLESSSIPSFLEENRVIDIFRNVIKSFEDVMEVFILSKQPKERDYDHLGSGISNNLIEKSITAHIVHDEGFTVYGGTPGHRNRSATISMRCMSEKNLKLISDIKEHVERMKGMLIYMCHDFLKIE